MGFESERAKAVRAMQGWFERLTEVMAAMADGDTVALGALYEEFGDPIRAAVRRELARLRVTHLDAAEVDGLALDVCTDLFRRAKSWDPTRGVAPWTWAALRIRGIVGNSVGQFTDPLPEGGPADGATEPAVSYPPAGRHDESPLVTLGRLAKVRSELRLLEEALGRVSRSAQQETLFEVRMQANQGDPSPAATIARARAVRPDSVRQTCKRVIDKVSDLAATDPHFAPLADLALLRKAS